jgi:hypothetical protein
LAHEAIAGQLGLEATYWFLLVAICPPHKHQASDSSPKDASDKVNDQACPFFGG